MAEAKNEGNKGTSVLKQALFRGTWFLGTKLYNAFKVKYNYFDWITPDILLGSIAKEKGKKTQATPAEIKAACQAQGKPLGLVIAVVDHHEMRDKSSAQWDKKHGIPWRQLALVDLAGAQGIKNENPFDSNSKLHEPLKDLLQEIANTIARGESVYIHCKAGKSRSWLISMACLMGVYKLSFDEAKLVLELNRPQVSPGSDKFVDVANGEAACRTMPINHNLVDVTQHENLQSLKNTLTQVLSRVKQAINLTTNQSLGAGKQAAIAEFHALLDRIINKDERAEGQKKDKNNALQQAPASMQNTTLLGTIYLLQALAHKTIPTLMQTIIPTTEKHPSPQARQVYTSLLQAQKDIITTYQQIILDVGLVNIEYANKVRPRVSRLRSAKEGAHIALGIGVILAVLGTIAALFLFGAFPGIGGIAEPFMQGAGILSGEIVSSLILGAASLVGGFLFSWIPAGSAYHKGEKQRIAKELAEQDENDDAVISEPKTSFGIALFSLLKIFILASAILSPLVALGNGMGGLLPPLFEPFLPTMGAFSGDFLTSLAIGAAAGLLITLFTLIFRACAPSKEVFNREALVAQVYADAGDVVNGSTNAAALNTLMQQKDPGASEHESEESNSASDRYDSNGLLQQGQPQPQENNQGVDAAPTEESLNDNGDSNTNFTANDLANF